MSPDVSGASVYGWKNHAVPDPSEPSTKPFYFVARALSVAATQTDAAGRFAGGGFVNVPANTALTARATVVANGLAFAPAGAFVRPGTTSISIVNLFAQTP